MRREMMRDELEEQQMEVLEVSEDSKGLRASVEFDGTETQLRNRLPDPYYVDSAMESTEGTTAMIRHRTQP